MASILQFTGMDQGIVGRGTVPGAWGRSLP